MSVSIEVDGFNNCDIFIVKCEYSGRASRIFVRCQDNSVTNSCLGTWLGGAALALGAPRGLSFVCSGPTSSSSLL